MATLKNKIIYFGMNKQIRLCRTHYCTSDTCPRESE